MLSIWLLDHQDPWWREKLDKARDLDAAPVGEVESKSFEFSRSK